MPVFWFHLLETVFRSPLHESVCWRPIGTPSFSPKICAPGSAPFTNTYKKTEKLWCVDFRRLLPASLHLRRHTLHWSPSLLVQKLSPKSQRVCSSRLVSKCLQKAALDSDLQSKYQTQHYIMHRRFRRLGLHPKPDSAQLKQRTLSIVWFDTHHSKRWIELCNEQVWIC